MINDCCFYAKNACLNCEYRRIQNIAQPLGLSVKTELLGQAAIFGK
jgi:hypothetical protein